MNSFVDWLKNLSLVGAMCVPLQINAAQEIGELLIGQEFEIVGELYAHGVTEDAKRPKKLSFISLEPVRLSGREILWQQQVALGSRMKVVEKIQLKYFIVFRRDEYIVQLNTLEPPPGVPIRIRLTAGNEGKSTALNPRIFKPIF